MNNVRISRENISSFVGEVIAVYLLSDKGLYIEGVEWVLPEQGVTVRRLDGDAEYGTEAGVILAFTECGEYTVKAIYCGREYTSNISVRKMRSFEGEEYNYYRGDLHVHTSMIHVRDPFSKRECDFPYDMLRAVKDEGKMDFTVISDHGEVLCDREFLRGFVDAERIEPIDTVIFPGSESEASLYEYDRFGTQHKHSGEVVILNSTGYSATQDWDEFVRDHEPAPKPLGIFAHPQVVGGGETGLWNNQYMRNRGKGLERIMRGVEMGNGENRTENQIHEYSYPDALDAGFFVSTTCSSDSHGPVFGMAACTGKTVIIASEKSREAFIDAIDNRRFYATESGNVKLSYSVNGIEAPATLPLTNEYRFKVNVGYFKRDKASEIVECQVVSDYGERILTVDADGKDTLDFSVSSDSARYFFLRLVDRKGRKTWSTPVITGRACDENDEKSYTPIDEGEYVICDENGSEQPILKDRNLSTDVVFPGETVTLTATLGAPRTVSAVGITHLKIYNHMVRNGGFKTPDLVKGFVSRYRISVSSDGENYDEVRSGRILVFGDEVLLGFEPREAKYVRLECLSTVGKESSVGEYSDAKVRISELSLFE